MSVDVSKHKDSMLDAWKDVVNDKTTTDWALFGYEKQTNNLMLVSKGDDGLEELVDELNSGKIMYAFCRVTDPNTSLPKFVLINWQGEGAPMSRKGCCANHIHDITNFFKGAHLTINARTEEDVDPPVILERLSKSTASKFNFKERSDPVENTSPVGTNYKRIQPEREINPTEREKFWLKEQEEEQKRVAEDKLKADSTKARLEQERKERELREAQAREQLVKERTSSINKVREAEKNVENALKTSEAERLQWDKQLQENAREEQDRRNRSEQMRRQRSNEAQALISQRTVNAKAIFEKNSCAGQMIGMATAKPPVKLPQEMYTAEEPVAASGPEHVPLTIPVYQETASVQQEVEVTKDQDIKDLYSEEGFSYTRNLLRDSLPPRQDSELTNPEEEQNWDEPPLEAPPTVRDPLTEMMVEHGITSSPNYTPSQVIKASNQGLRARALYDYQAADATEISFDPDDIITHIEQIDEGWWQGLAPNGYYGLFPANYVELLD
ncbi:drebrin-like protein B isoform X1 [Limulus polyphemus]|uniref:Drebrin-like protein B isoform X1 n=2 Tax=Limulus polyphemus TaxID=6850 RepID=A0ABM1BIE4_LIMPO|nr:drebrin-like protein B isoform X1 [Limulus polyphemus]